MFYFTCNHGLTPSSTLQVGAVILCKYRYWNTAETLVSLTSAKATMDPECARLLIAYESPASAWTFITMCRGSLWLVKSGLVRLDSRREEITQCTFRQVKCPTHPLHHMLPPCRVSTSQMTLRPTYPFTAPKCKKNKIWPGYDSILHSKKV